jgi:DNA-binding transcriptional LysR family regulator
MPKDATDLRFFVAITEAGSLAEAARRMDVTPSAVSQHLRQMEQRLGVQLVQRSTRRFSLTGEGELFYAGSVDLLAQLDQLTDNLRVRSGEVAGKLDICGPLGFGRRYLAPLLADFCTLHPRLKVSLTLADKVPASEAQRFDLVVHIGHLPDSSLVAHSIAPNARFLCAAPEYLARRPAPLKPDELAQQDSIVQRENREDVTLWRLRRNRSEVAVRVPPALWSNDGEVVKQWALMGKGIMLRSEWHVAEDLAAGRLVRVLPEWKLPDADVVALSDQRTGVPARVRLFLAFLQERFKPRPPWRDTGRQAPR